MYYSMVGCLALATLVIINYDVLARAEGASGSEVEGVYRRFLYAIILYYVTDILWGILFYLRATALLYVDTVLYFIAMALGVMCWTQYVVAYLGQENVFRRFLHSAGRTFFFAATGVTLLNILFPVMFWFDGSGGYHPGLARFAVLFSQILLLLLTVVYALRISAKTEDPVRQRHLTIGLSGLLMLVFISVQLFFPLLPLYATAYMLGSCLLRSFVVENEKEEYRRELEVALQKESQHIEELNRARKIAFTDSLTGVKSKSAYADCIQHLQSRLNGGESLSLALGMLDCDNLKPINDQYGHERGDEYLKNAAGLICRIFGGSQVYRVGGDEFAVILLDGDFETRKELAAQFETAQRRMRAAATKPWECVSIAIGIAVYDPATDYSIDDVLQRADQLMYEDKRLRKATRGKGD